MTDKKLSGLPPPSLSSPSPHNGVIRGTAPKCSPPPHHNGSLEARPGCHSPSNTSAAPQPHSAPSRTSASTSPLRTLRTLGGLLTPVPGLGPEGSSTRPRGQSVGSALSSRTRTTTSRTKVTVTDIKPAETLPNWFGM